VDLDDQGNVTALGARFRNLREEEAAMRAGLAPGQIRQGLRLLAATLDRIEALGARLGKAALVLEAIFYHNALLYERHGFGYLAAQQRMEAIHRGFLPGGDLDRRMDGSTPFVRPRREPPSGGGAGPSTTASCPVGGGLRHVPPHRRAPHGLHRAWRTL
jgi:acetoin utilization protein AcuC